MTQKEKVYGVLKGRKWIKSATINTAAGSQYGTRRARELRDEGITLKTRNLTGETEYRIA